MKFGAERNKIAVLAGLALILVYVIFFNSDDDAPRSAPPAASKSASSPPPASGFVPSEPRGPAVPRRASAPSPRARREGVSMEFRPSLKPGKPEDRPDPLTIDPTLRLDLLAKLQNISLEGGERSLFDFSQPPPPKTPEPKIVPQPVKKTVAQAEPAKPVAAAKPPKPKAPPIPLKFYGFASPAENGPKRAFFLDGDEVHVATEGEVVKKRYKVVRIGVNSVVMEDEQFHDQQTLGLVPELKG